MQLRALDHTRDQARRRLAQIADENGSSSALYQRCRELWEQREEAAFASLLHGDFHNAAVILQRGLQVLAHGPEVVTQDGLPLEDALKLMSAW